MQTDSVKLARLAIQQKALVAVKCDGTNSEDGRVLIDNATAINDLGDQGIEIGVVHVPALRICDRETDRNAARSVG